METKKHGNGDWLHALQTLLSAAEEQVQYFAECHVLRTKAEDELIGRLHRLEDHLKSRPEPVRIPPEMERSIETLRLFK